MPLIIDERAGTVDGELLLGAAVLPVRCRLTVEYLRGIAEPTWYGYFVPLDVDIHILPGRYPLRLPGVVCEILVRRRPRTASGRSFSFWGLGAPPDLPPAGPDEPLDP